MFWFPPTLDSILSGFTKTITDLGALILANEDAREANDKEIDVLALSNEGLIYERGRAVAVRANLEKLMKGVL